MFLMLLQLKLDYEDYGNSDFTTAVKNITKKEFFSTKLFPELFLQNFVCINLTNEVVSTC